MFELNLFCFILNLSVAVLAGALISIIPVLTRKSYLFGVKIPLEHSGCPEAKSMKKNYVSVCVAGSALISALMIVQYITAPDMTLLCAMYFPFLFVAVQMAAFIPNWKKAGKLKEERGWAVAQSSVETDSSRVKGNMSELPWIWYIAGLLLIIISLIVALIQYPSLPDKIPTHFDANMQPDSWVDKSLGGMILMPVINLCTLALLWFCGFMFVRAKLQIDPQNPGLSFTQHTIYRRRMGHSLGFLALCLVVLFALLGFMTVFPDFTVPFWVIMGLSFVPVVPVIAVSVKSGQGGFRIKPKTIMEKDGIAVSGGAQGRGDDKFWIIGMFYYNPGDPAHIVEDRFGNNLGFNYARLSVKIGAAILLAALIATYIWATVLIGNI